MYSFKAARLSRPIFCEGFSLLSTARQKSNDLDHKGRIQRLWTTHYFYG
jgi:hypothetical protein